ncbi:mCG147610 [Mus musculus]|nr:mCG147610 [Mus musculus]
MIFNENNRTVSEAVKDTTKPRTASVTDQGSCLYSTKLWFPSSPAHVSCHSG